MANRLFDTHNNSIMPHENHMFNTAYNITVAKMCAYTSSNYTLKHWKCALCYCAQWTCMSLQSIESDQNNSNVIPTMQFHVYQHISHYTAHVRHPYNE